MKVIVCLDDRGGMMFAKRRQSQDRIVVEDICKMTDVLHVTPYSEKLFAGRNIKLEVCKEICEEAGKDSVCFVEDTRLKAFEEEIEELIVYRWNRRYPSDQSLDISLQEWKLTWEEEFAGFSHEKITKQVYVKEEA